MKKSAALILFVAACALLATLPLAGVIKPAAAGGLFAAALAVTGGLSRGFRKG